MASERDLFLRRVLRVYTHPLQTLLFVLVGSAILFDPALFQPFFSPPFFPPLFNVRLVGLAFISFSVILMLFNYLQYGERRSESRSYAGATDDYRVVRETERSNQFIADQYTVLEHELAAIRSAIEKGVASHVIELSPAEKSKLLEDVSKSIETTLSQSFLKAVDSKYSEEALRGAERRFLFGDVDSVRRRLTSEVDALRRRANSNLAIGSVTTVLAMTSLAYIALGREATFDTGTSILSYYVPRISFVIFIEVFAYFFLRLYKANLGDIKFYQNELTTIESKALALKSALIEGKPGALAGILRQLSLTERNFVLKKGETTVELERDRIESAREYGAVKSVRGMLNQIRRSKEK